MQEHVCISVMQLKVDVAGEKIAFQRVGVHKRRRDHMLITCCYYGCLLKIHIYISLEGS